MAMAPISTRIGEGRCFRGLWKWRLLLARNSVTSTSPSRAWKICSCTTREGACGRELDHIFRLAVARCARGAPKPDVAIDADHAAAAADDVCVRQGDDAGWTHAGKLQGDVGAGNHGHEHGNGRDSGSIDAADRRVSVYARDGR